jgi:hypothetical protein
MSNTFDSLDSALNIESNIVEVEKVKDDLKISPLKVDDIQKDFEKGQEAINGIMELAGEGGSPRAYEVAGQLIKSVGDVTDKLIDLQKKLKDVEDESVKTTNNVTNNAVFVGSTSELSKLLKQGFLNNKE